MKNKIEYYKDPHAIGTMAYHKVSLIMPLVCTDGALVMFDKLQCYWVADIVASYMKKYLKQEFLVFKVHLKKSGGCTYIAEDGNYNKINSQEIEYTDLKENIQMFAQWTYIQERKHLVIMLPTEY